MPKETFFNLPDEKKRFIEDVAIDEFAEYGYDKASINRIVKNSKIAKGSFYQYFDDKKDLFKHLLSRMANEKMEYMAPLLSNITEMNFFTLLKEMYVAGLKFANSSPKIVIMANQVMKNKSHPIYQETVSENMGTAYSTFSKLLQLSISRGEIRPDIDTRFISYIISALNIATIEYYFEVVKGKEIDINEFDDDIMETVDLFIDLIKNGIRKQTGGNDND